jgi:hypothetical protein
MIVTGCMVILYINHPNPTTGIQEAQLDRIHRYKQPTDRAGIAPGLARVLVFESSARVSWLLFTM